MDKEKARAFLEELWKLEEKYGISVSATYEEDFDYDYEDNLYASGGQVMLTLVDKEGHEISIDEVECGVSTCLYCGRNINNDAEFCHLDCETKYKANQKN